MKKLGVLIHQISGSQQYVAISHNLNNICHKHREIDPVLFYNDIGKINIKNEFSLLQSVEALDYNGVLIATDILSAHFLPKCLRATKRYLYVWDIDWHIKNRDANFIKNIYLNPDIELLARSQDHANLISRVFRKPKHIIEEFNYEQLINQIV